MPAALVIAPAHGGIAVKTTSLPTPSAAGDAFGQVLQSVRDATMSHATPVTQPADVETTSSPMAAPNGTEQPAIVRDPSDVPAAKTSDLSSAIGTQGSAAEPVRGQTGHDQPVVPRAAVAVEAMWASPAPTEPAGVGTLTSPVVPPGVEPASVPQTVMPTPAAFSPNASVAIIPAAVVPAVAGPVTAVPMPIVSDSPLRVSAKPSLVSRGNTTTSSSPTAIGQDAVPPPLPDSSVDPVAATVVPDSAPRHAPVAEAAPAPSTMDPALIPTAPNVATPVASVPIHKEVFGTDPIPVTAATEQTGDTSQPDLVAPAITLFPVTSSATNAATAPAHTTALATPVAQIAPALLTLAKTTDGNQQMTVRLQPDDLGMVQVRIERTSSGATQVEITADKSDTLQVLRQDQPQLHHMLDEAGIPAAGRTVTFHVAQPAQASAGSNASGHGGGQQASSGRMNGGSPDAGGSPGSGKGGYPARETTGSSGGRRQGGTPVAAGANPTGAPQSYRIGLDITA